MKKYLGSSLVMIIGLIMSCAREGEFGPQGPGGWGPMMHYGFGYGGMFMWLIFLIVIGLLIYFIFQANKTKGQPMTHIESPLDILKWRYAKGEIARDEFERMKKDLEG